LYDHRLQPHGNSEDQAGNRSSYSRLCSFHLLYLPTR
jgi:hypothetical protein